VNEGPTCCTGKLYWCAVKKACYAHQCEAPPMYGAYGGASMTTMAKGLTAPVAAKGSVMLVALHAKVPMAATASNGPAVPTAEPAGVLMMAAENGSMTRGWRHVAATTLMTVPGGALTAAAAAKEALKGAPAMKPAGALATTAEDRAARGWGRVMAVVTVC
jgi:hypothetical protein